MPRAGSTLLQNILAQNPDMHATPTSGLVHLVHTAKKGYTENVEFKGSDQYDWKKHFFKFVKGGMESLASSVDDKKYFIDKSRGWLNHMDILSEIYKKHQKYFQKLDSLGYLSSGYTTFFSAVALKIYVELCNSRKAYKHQMSPFDRSVFWLDLCRNGYSQRFQTNNSTDLAPLVLRKVILENYLTQR